MAARIENKIKILIARETSISCITRTAYLSIPLIEQIIFIFIL